MCRVRGTAYLLIWPLSAVRANNTIHEDPLVPVEEIKVIPRAFFAPLSKSENFSASKETRG